MKTMVRTVFVKRDEAAVFYPLIQTPLGSVAETLSQVAITGIIGVVLICCLKSLFENLSKNNAWPDKPGRAAEQLFDAAEGGKKKKWVLERLAEKGIQIDGTALDAMVEAAVQSLHQALVQPQGGH